MIKVVNVDGLNLRKGPGTNYSIIKVLLKNTEVEVISESNGWSNIKYGELIGYVSTKYILEKNIGIETIKKVVNVDGLNLRKGPGINYEVITVLSRNTEVEVILESNGWSNVKYGTKNGYVATQYLTNKSNDNSILNNKIVDKAIDIAKSKLGYPYVWGAEGPKSFDCSGFIYYIFKINLNINVPRVSKDQSKYGNYIDRKDLKPGDLVFFDTDGTNNGNVSHVGMYLGNNEFIQASSGSTMKVVISKLEGYYDRQYVTARRIL
ncbi:MAG: SH3 domain-containing protein [Paraclostridium sp.]